MATTTTKKDNTAITPTRGKTKAQLLKMNTVSLVAGILGARKTLREVLIASLTCTKTVETIIKKLS